MNRANYNTRCLGMLENILLMQSSPLNTRSVERFFIPDLCQGRAVFLLVLVSELCVLAVVLAGSGIREFSWDYLAALSLFVQWVVLSSAYLLCAFRQRLSMLSLQHAVTAAFVVILMITLLLSLVAGWIMAGTVLMPSRWHLDLSALIRNVVISAIMTGMVLRYFYVHSRLRSQEQAELQARIQALQSRIRPHFLFNSMNSIASLIRSEPLLAEQAVEDLAELFRASLKEADKPISLEQEVALCQRYVGIEKLRLGERLNIDWQLPEHPIPATIPMLTLQPIIENAIYHGIQPLAMGGTVTILVEPQPEALQITVSNPFIAEQTPRAKRSASNHIALENIRARMVAIYGSKARLKTWVEDSTYVAQLNYPLVGPGKDGVPL